MDLVIHFLQWPAMAVSILGVWWVGDTARTNRRLGFIVLMLSNVIWLIWAITDEAWALLVMQVIFLVLNGRGYYDSLDQGDKVRQASTSS